MAQTIQAEQSVFADRDKIDDHRIISFSLMIIKGFDEIYYTEFKHLRGIMYAKGHSIVFVYLTGVFDLCGI